METVDKARTYREHWEARHPPGSGRAKVSRTGNRGAEHATRCMNLCTLQMICEVGLQALLMIRMRGTSEARSIWRDFFEKRNKEHKITDESRI